MKLFSTVVPYLLLVSFSTGNMANFNQIKIDAIGRSPYNGVAVYMESAYSTTVHPINNYIEKGAYLGSATDKDIWPWVFFNRIVGYREGDKSNSLQSNTPYFRRIKGVDIFDQSGALSDFIDLWTISLRLAKKFECPGILIDPEFYNNYKNYQVQYVASQQGRSVEEIIEGLKNLGSILFSVAESEYPDATLWFLFSRLSEKEKILNQRDKKKYYSTVSYIIIGMLESAKAQNSNIKLICGGETFLGYCSSSLNHIRKKIATRNRDYSEMCMKYPNLFLGGTIAPWTSVEHKTSWMVEGICGSSEIKDADEFQPLFKHLLLSYDFVWIYAASAGGYNPYENTDIFNRALESAVLEAKRARENEPVRPTR